MFAADSLFGAPAVVEIAAADEAFVAWMVCLACCGFSYGPEGRKERGDLVVGTDDYGRGLW